MRVQGSGFSNFQALQSGSYLQFFGHVGLKEMLYKAFGTTVCGCTIGMLKLTVSDQEHFLGRLNLEFRFSVLGFKGFRS